MLAGDKEIEIEIVVVEGDNLLVWKEDNGLWYLEGCMEGFTTMDELYKKMEKTI